MLLNVKPVLQSKRAKLILAQVARKIAPHLVAHLFDSFVNQALINLVVDIHEVFLDAHVEPRRAQRERSKNAWLMRFWHIPGNSIELQRPLT